MAELYANYAARQDQEQRHFPSWGGVKGATQLGSQIFLTSFWPNQIAAQKPFSGCPETSSSC